METDKPLRILFISPKGGFFSNNEEFTKFADQSRELQTIRHFWNGVGIGLLILAALTPEEHEITMVDENLENIPFDKDWDIVGITAMTQQATRAYRIAERFRENGVHTVIGGIHATVMQEEASRYADTVFTGESENSWPVFIDDFTAGNPGKVYRQSDFPTVQLPDLPVPRYDLLSKYKYPVVFVQTTRGCPHDCEFCVASNVYGKAFRRKTEDQVIEEILEVKKHWKHVQIGFADDNMFVNRKFSKSLVARFKEIYFSWFAVCDISIGEDEEFIRELHDSGCRSLLIGFESVRKENLSNLQANKWKEKKHALYRSYIRRIQEQGLGVYGSFIFGMDQDDPEVIDDTIDFIVENNLLGGHATIMTPYPGCRLRTRFENENRVLHDHWEEYTLWNSVIRHPRMTSEELEDGAMRLLMTIYNKENNQKRAEYFQGVCRKLVQSRESE
jgi:radical SAM superfamily enzyme YgiQ (UPF0313 family)